MDDTTRHTIKVDTATLEALRILAAYQGKRVNALVRELALTALAKEERKRSQTKGARS